MNSTHIISQDVFDKVRSRFTNLQMGDEQGAVTSDPKQARFFDFDFVVNEENLGRVSISINEVGALKMFYSQGILEDTGDYVHQLWYDFLREMRMFAKRRLLRFDTRDITKSNLDKNDYQYLANTGSKENEMNMSESIKFEGGPKTSFRKLEKSKLILKHKSPVNAEQIGARSRKNNIESIFIENEEGERYKFPYIYIAGAKAMQRHVSNGGRPYDEHGGSILKMCEQIAQLSSFKKHMSLHDGMNQEANGIAERASAKLDILKRQMESMCGQGGYESWTESFTPVDEDENFVLDQATMEDYKHKFTVSSFKEDLAQYFPLIHSIMQEAGTIDLEDLVTEGNTENYCDSCDRPEDKCICDDEPKESINFETFENWADRIAEGKLGMDQIGELNDLLQKGLALDADGSSAITALQGIGINDEELEDALMKLSDVNVNADPKDTILAWLAKDDPEAAKELGYTDNSEQPDAAPEPTAPAADEPASQEEPQEDIEERPDAPTANLKEIAEMVHSFYDGETRKFPKGKTGVKIHVEKELGEKAGNFAEMLINYLEQDVQADEELNDISRLAGMRDEGMLDKAKEFGKKVLDKVAPGDEELLRRLQRDSGVPAHAQHGKPSMATPNHRQQQESSEFEDILKLSGLAK